VADGRSSMSVVFGSARILDCAIQCTDCAILRRRFRVAVAIARQLDCL